MKKHNGGLSLPITGKKWSGIFLLIIGMIIFYQTSGLELGYFGKVYLMAIEIKVVLFVLYRFFFTSYLPKK